MTQEEKELLYKDLCMRLPYKVRCLCEWKKPAKNGTIGFVDELSTYLLDEFEWMDEQEDISFKNLKPYLRHMSSMTEEEKEEMHNLLSPEGTAIYENDGIALPINHCGEFVPYEFMGRIIQYLLGHHFDFMGLIPKDMAIEVIDENNPYKE